MKKTVLLLYVISFCNLYAGDLIFDYYECEINLYEKLTMADIEQEPLEILRIMRNQIFAHYGKTFKDSLLQNYFESKFWYKANPQYNDSLLSQTERENVVFISLFEAKIREKHRESSRVKVCRNKLDSLGVMIDKDLKIADFLFIDLNNKGSKEAIVLTIPWQILTIYGNIDPGDYTGLKVFTFDDGKPFEYVIETESYFDGEKIDGDLKELAGTEYIVYADNNENGYTEFYLHEAALASGPGYLTVLEFSDGKIVERLRMERMITRFIDIDSDGLKELVTDVYYQHYGTVSDLFPYLKKIYYYDGERYQKDMDLTKQYVMDTVQKEVNGFTGKASMETYLNILRNYLQLACMGEQQVVKDAVELINRYHAGYENKPLQFDTMPGKDVLIKDFKEKSLEDWFK